MSKEFLTADNVAKKVNWRGLELDRYYRKMGEPEKVWKDNEGMPFGIEYYDFYECRDDDCEAIDVEWFETKQKRDSKWESIVREAMKEEYCK
tara:strand:- start:177 stop:452 length:276 start_codon:yes stop_codon:yes gene_type:complete